MGHKWRFKRLSPSSKECQKAAWKQHKKVCREAPTLKSTPPDAPVAGVRVKGPVFHPEGVTIAPDHRVWTKGTISPISQLIGLPVIIHREERERGAAGIDAAVIERALRGRSAEEVDSQYV